MNRFTIFLILAMSLSYAATAQLKYPTTDKGNVVDDYFGTKVADPYRWLEKEDSSKTKEWVDTQSKFAFDYLEKIPFRNQIKKRIEELWNYPKFTAPQKVGNYYFFSKNDGLQPQAVIYVQEGANGTPKVFLDPNTFSSDGTIALGGIYPSNDNKYMAYAVQKSGSDWREFFVMDIATGKKLDDHIEWAKFAGASWWKDGFFYSAFDKPTDGTFTSKNEFMKLYYHKLGTPQSKDELIWEDKTNGKRSHYGGATEDERYIILYIGEGGKKGNLLYVKDTKHPERGFIPVQTEFGYEVGVIESEGDNLYIYTNLDAPKNKVVVTSIADPSSKNWKPLIPEKQDVLENVAMVDGKLIATYMKDASHHVFIHDMNGKMLHEVSLPAVGSVGGFGGRKTDKEVFYTFTSFTYPATIYRYNIDANTSTVFRKSEVKFKSDDYVSKQIFYTSKDGTKIPMFIVHKKGIKLDGTNPTMLYGYGGFNVSLTPSFSTPRIALLEQGAVFAMPNLRGGGEYGEEWHEAGTKLRKQNVFDDFIAAAEYLFKEKYTSPEHLALAGGSNGGLLVGAVVNQRPDICKVALPAVGVMDMLRYHKFTIGFGWSRDYGTSEESKEMFEYLYKYSPLHSIRKGINYPATMITTADHDDRVVPAHSFKYAAALQDIAGSSTKNPLIIRIETKAGHGAGKPTQKIIEEIADEYSFMFYNMGIMPKY
jgi:prolyl oligopeptidase